MHDILSNEPCLLRLIGIRLRGSACPQKFFIVCSLWMVILSQSPSSHSCSHQYAFHQILTPFFSSIFSLPHPTYISLDLLYSPHVHLLGLEQPWHHGHGMRCSFFVVPSVGYRMSIKATVSLCYFPDRTPFRGWCSNYRAVAQQKNPYCDWISAGSFLISPIDELIDTCRFVSHGRSSGRLSKRTPLLSFVSWSRLSSDHFGSVPTSKLINLSFRRCAVHSAIGHV